jgi:hypothetical protein
MAETTEPLAFELGKSERQVLNYKRSVEKHCGFPTTFQQGKQHFYRPQYVHLVRVYAKGEPLPEVAREVEVIHTEVLTSGERAEEGAELVLSTRKLAATEPLQVRPLHLIDVDAGAIDAQTTHN